MQADTARNADMNTSSSQLVVLRESPGYEDCINPPSDKTTTKPATENPHDTSGGGPQRQTMLQKIQVSSSVFKGSIIAAYIPFVSADAGEDFSNNLFTDLAPILALFGEQVAKQYMSQSMGRVEDLIFACAPLGIITAMVAAIRVGGPGVMQAIIGRARESRGVVEVELMSSTSADVCELWDGKGVIRVLGSSPIIELYYLQSDPGNTSSGAVDDDMIPLMERDRGMGIWDFESAISEGLLERGPGDSLGSDNSTSSESLLAHKVVPNIGLNLSGQRVSNLEFMLVAVAGVVLQAGVVVFAGVGTYLSPWNGNFKKGNKPVQKHAFPSMAGGTVALVIGMFLCCYIVERSTTENTWAITEPDGHRVRVAWLQRGGEVNDQHFKSYILHRRHSEPSKFLHAVRKLIKMPSKSETCVPIKTSHKGENRDQGYLTILAVAVSLAGFIFQFVGLRALTWHVSIAQLGATGAMTGLRAALRRNLIHEPEGEEIKVSGYELEAMAMKISDCDHWDVSTWKPSPDGDQTAIETSSASAPSAPVGGSGVAPGGIRIASKIMDSRRRLGALSMWSSGCQMTAGIVVQAIEASMNFLWTNPDVKLSNTPPSDTFEWKLFVEVSKPQSGEGGPTATYVHLRLSRKILPNGTWSPWKAVRNEIEAVLGLWMYHLKRLESGPESPARNRGSDWMEDEQALGLSRNYRIVGNGDVSNKADYKKWLLPQTELVSTEEKNTIGRPNPHRTQCLAVLSGTPLERICGQHIFSTFLANVVDVAVDSITGKVRVRGSEQGIRDSFELRHAVIDGLLNEVERTGLATPEEALLSIVPALGGKYSTSAATTEAFSDLANEISTYLEGGLFERAEALLLWLLDATESDAKRHEELQNWREACKTYFLLFETYTKIGSKSFARRAKEATVLFFERFRSLDQTKGSEETRKTQDLGGEVWGEMQMDSWKEAEQRLIKWQERREQAGDSTAPRTANKKNLLNAAADGDYHGVTSALEEAEDINSHDSMGRTSLMLACRSGHANITMKLLSRNADPCREDKYGRTAIHYAARRNNTSALHALLLYEKASAAINAVDRKDKSPLGLAIESGAGAAVALLIFYGAEDPEGSAKELLKLSAHRGSYAAVKVALDKNSKDDGSGRTSLHWAVWRGEVAVMESLLQNNVEVEAKENDGFTALHLAARCGCDTAVEFLIQQLRADRNAESGDGKTALHLACAGGHDSTVELLIQELGADVNAESRDGRNALHLACAGGHDFAVALLIRQLGVKVNAKSRDGKTALHLACAGGHDSTVELLIQELGADMNAQSGDGRNALHFACVGGYDSTVALLIRQLGAEVNAESGDGKTAVQLAIAGGHDSTVELLIQELGADMNAQSRDGRNALHFACAGGYDSAVVLLIRQLGAEVNAKSREGRNALHLACEGGHDSTVELLIQQLGAEVNAETEDGKTALHLACAGGLDSTIQLLIRRFKAEISRGHSHETALYLLVRYMYVLLRLVNRTEV